LNQNAYFIRSYRCIVFYENTQWFPQLNVTNLCDFEDATRLFYSNEQVANYNHEQLTILEHPIAHINARHSSALAKKISSDDISGLEPVVFLAKGARVMLTMNLWSCVNLCNGATGTVYQYYLSE
jgi:hypothetical protein